MGRGAATAFAAFTLEPTNQQFLGDYLLKAIDAYLFQ